MTWVQFPAAEHFFGFPLCLRMLAVHVWLPVWFFFSLGEGGEVNWVGVGGEVGGQKHLPVRVALVLLCAFVIRGLAVRARATPHVDGLLGMVPSRLLTHVIR